jgi:hypothetical protein
MVGMKRVVSFRLAATIVLVATVAGAGCSHGKGAPESRQPTTTRAATTLMVRATTSLLSTSSPGKAPTITAVNPSALTIGGEFNTTFSEAYEVFQPSSENIECIASVHLLITVTDGAHDSIAIYPAMPALAGSAHIGSVLSSETLLDNRPTAQALAVLGEMSFDVTDIYKLWVTQKPFPSQGRFVDANAPVVLAIRPPTLDSGRHFTVFGTPSASDARSPRLDIASTHACSSP